MYSKRLYIYIYLYILSKRLYIFQKNIYMIRTWPLQSPSDGLSFEVT